MSKSSCLQWDFFKARAQNTTKHLTKFIHKVLALTLKQVLTIKLITFKETNNFCLNFYMMTPRRKLNQPSLEH